MTYSGAGWLWHLRIREGRSRIRPAAGGGASSRRSREFQKQKAGPFGAAALQGRGDGGRRIPFGDQTTRLALPRGAAVLPRSRCRPGAPRARPRRSGHRRASPGRPDPPQAAARAGRRRQDVPRASHQLQARTTKATITHHDEVLRSAGADVGRRAKRRSPPPHHRLAQQSRGLAARDLSP